jgi:hypothetical protein
MPLTRTDFLELSREIEALLLEYDPGALDVVLRATDPVDDPRTYVLGLLRTVERVYAERSSGTLRAVLDSLNSNVRLPNGSPIRGISVSLSPIERELYHADDVNLAELPDRSKFLTELRRLTQEIEREPILPENER